MRNPPQKKPAQLRGVQDALSNKEQVQSNDGPSVSADVESYEKLRPSGIGQDTQTEFVNENLGKRDSGNPDVSNPSRGSDVKSSDELKPFHHRNGSNDLVYDAAYAEPEKRSRRENPKPKHSNVEQELWWLDLEQIYIPQVQKPNEAGGAVEINFAVIPDYEDYRPVVFEDIEDAKTFLGVFGIIVGEGAQVRVVGVSPRGYLSTADVNTDNIVVLAKGSLMLSRKMGYTEVVGAIRFATQFTSKKYGGYMNDKLPDELLEETGADKGACDAAMKSAADELMAGLKETLKDPYPQQTTPSAGVNGRPSTKKQNPERDISDLLGEAMLGSLDSLESSSPGSREPNTPNSAKSPPADKQAAIDAEIVHEPETSEQPMDDGLNVIYPPGWEEGSKGKPRDSLWYMSKSVVYLPQYLDDANASNFLAFKVGEEERPVVLGFEDEHDAHVCAKVVSLFEEQKGYPTRVIPIGPNDLRAWCKAQSNDLQALILRKGSLPLELGMTQDQFVSFIGVLAQVQEGDYSGL